MGGEFKNAALIPKQGGSKLFNVFQSECARKLQKHTSAKSSLQSKWASYKPDILKSVNLADICCELGVA